MAQTEYTLIVYFSGRARYPLQLDGTLKHYGLLAAQILRCLSDSFVDPLPNPKHLILKNSSGDVITADGLWERALSGYYPDGAAHIISVEQGKSRTSFLRGWGNAANVGDKTARRRPLLPHWSKKSGLSQASCCFFPSWASMRSRPGRSSAHPRGGKSSTRGTSLFVPSWVGASS